MSLKRITVEDIRSRKIHGPKITMLTAYDYPTAVLMDTAGIDILLVGDSLANVVLGLEATKDIGMAEMLHHARAVVRGAQHALVIGDMPYVAYQAHPQAALDNARQFMDIGCHAVKIEWFEGCLTVAQDMIQAGIPVMGHVGLTPQTALEMKVQGKTVDTAQRIIDQAIHVQEIGCFGVVLECVPKEVAALITKKISIPTFGIGAGLHCDGQVLVSHDMLGFMTTRQPKFSKKYADLAPLMVQAFKDYARDVQSGAYPDDAHSFHMPADQAQKFLSEP